jgi:ribonuclease HI
MNQIFCDGGVIGPNPSAIGGTWAYRSFVNEVLVNDLSGVIICNTSIKITNNITEMLALVHGLESLPDNWNGRICSDSLVTIGRASLGWQWNHMPLDIVKMWEVQRRRLLNYGNFVWINLKGHPTKKELSEGVSKEGRPVHLQNKLCDKECTRLATLYMKEHGYE